MTLTVASDVFPLFQHPGTGFIYMLAGKTVYGHGAYEYRWNPAPYCSWTGKGRTVPSNCWSCPSGFWPWQQSSGISSARHRLSARTWRERLQSAGKTLVIATGQRVGPRRQKRHQPLLTDPF